MSPACSAATTRAPSRVERAMAIGRSSQIGPTMPPRISSRSAAVSDSHSGKLRLATDPSAASRVKTIGWPFAMSGAKIAKKATTESHESPMIAIGLRRTRDQASAQKPFAAGAADAAHRVDAGDGRRLAHS
jgi:hypothetical protein